MKCVCVATGDFAYLDLIIIGRVNMHVYNSPQFSGKLGLGDQESRYTPFQIPPEHFHNETITHISCGGIHSSAVSAAGHVFTWGCGSDGRLGHPEAAGHR